MTVGGGGGPWGGVGGGTLWGGGGGGDLKVVGGAPPPLPYPTRNHLKGGGGGGPPPPPPLTMKHFRRIRCRRLNDNSRQLHRASFREDSHFDKKLRSRTTTRQDKAERWCC